MLDGWEVCLYMIIHYLLELFAVIKDSETLIVNWLGGGSSFSPSRDTDEPDESNPSPETPNTMKKRKRPPRGVDSLVAILERGFEAHRQVMLDCEERRDVRHREVLEANRQALDRQLESQERIATGYTTVFLGVTDALREVARRFN